MAGARDIPEEEALRDFESFKINRQTYLRLITDPSCVLLVTSFDEDRRVYETLEGQEGEYTRVVAAAGL